MASSQKKRSKPSPDDGYDSDEARQHPAFHNPNLAMVGLSSRHSMFRGKKKSSKALRILVYNYKGGCGKTTICAHLGAQLALDHPWAKVLMIDCDPQCNLTSYYADYNTKIGESRDGKKTDDRSDDTSAAHAMMAMNDKQGDTDIKLDCDEKHSYLDNSPMTVYVKANIKPALYTAFHLFGNQKANLVKNIFEKKESFSCVNPKAYGDALWLLEGSPLLSQSFSESMNKSQEVKEECNHRSVCLLNHIMNVCEEKWKFDFILVDVNPTGGVLNRNAAFACDYILPPASPTLFSCTATYGCLYSNDDLMGKKNMGILQQWMQKRKLLVDLQWDDDYLDENGDDMEEWRIQRVPFQLLPFMINNYPREKEKKEMVVGKAHSQFLHTMEVYVSDYVGSLRAGDNKVRVLANHGRYTIPLLPSSTIVGTLESLGQAFVEVTVDDLIAYYASEADGRDTISKVDKKAFEAFVQLGKERFFSLSKWIKQLAGRKNGMMAQAPEDSSDSGGGGGGGESPSRRER